MTTPKKPADVVALPDNKKLAKSVAKELEARQRRRKVLLLLLLAAAIALAVTYGTCGRGWGLGGGKGKGEGSGPGPGSAQGVMTVVVDAAPTRCAIELTAAGLTVDGKSMTREEAITTCKTKPGADVLIKGDAKTGDAEDLKAALDEAKIVWKLVTLDRNVGSGSDGSAGTAGSAGSAGSADATGSADSAGSTTGGTAGSATGGAAGPTDASGAAGSATEPAGSGS